jgi:hypothetical protein
LSIGIGVAACGECHPQNKTPAIGRFVLAHDISDAAYIWLQGETIAQQTSRVVMPKIHPSAQR